MPEKISCNTCCYKEDLTDLEIYCTRYNIKKYIHDSCPDWLDDEPITCEVSFEDDD